MAYLNASKSSMRKLVWENRTLIGLVIPIPKGKELSFRTRSDGDHILHWTMWGHSYRFILHNPKRPTLIAEIYDEGKLVQRNVIPLVRDDLRKRGMLVDGKEES